MTRHEAGVHNSCLAARLEKPFHAAVRRLTSIVALLLAALWLPASSHALLEHFELIHHVHADHEEDSDDSHEHGTNNHAAADGLCLAPSVKTPLSKPVAVVPLPWLAVALLNTAQNFFALPSQFGPSPPGTAPPELSHCWQFSFRAALPARAPSLAS
jgi:hypothetical protein